MKKLNRLAAALAAAAIALTSVSCGLLDELEEKSAAANEKNEKAAAEAEKKQSSGKDSQTSEPTDPEEPPEEVKNYSWVIEPTIEADNIFCPNNTYHKSETLGGFENSVILNDGGYAVIDRSGNVLNDEPADVFTIYESADEDLGLGLYTKDYREVCSVNKTTASSDSFEYVYDTVSAQLAVNSDLGLPADLDAAVLKTGQAAAVKLSSEDGAKAQYCIYSDGTADTSALYDNYAQPMGGMPDGGYVICVEKDGKWGYVNSSGKMILDCEYDACYYPSGAAYDYWQNDPQDTEPQFAEPLPYLDSEGYIAVEKNGMAGYYDLQGTAVIELGEFEAARPVYGGTAWVKKDGRWGVIKLAAADAVPADPSGDNSDASSDQDSSAVSTESDITDFSSEQPLESASSNNSQTLEYAKIIDRCKEICDEDPENYSQFSAYYVVDIDDDGVMELITDIGSCEADRLATVYSYDGTQAVEIGTFVSWRSYFGEGDGVLYSEATAMGSYTLSSITIENGELVVERGEAVGESKLLNPLTPYSFDDLSGLELI